MYPFKYSLFDIETDGFKPTTIFCLSMTDLVSREKRTYTGGDVAEGIDILLKAEMIVGHYIRGFDCPAIEKLLDGLVAFDKSKIVDTVEMSRRLTDFQKHSLKVWGPIVGLEKMEAPLFESFTPELIPYCERDVEVNVLVFFNLLERYLAGNRKVKFTNSDLVDRFFLDIAAIAG